MRSMIKPLQKRVNRIFCILLVLSIFSFHSLSAQDSTLRFQSIIQSGIAVGENHNGFVLQAVNGIKKDRWFAGIGLGYDGYMNNTFPLFSDFRFDIGSKHEAFVYGSLGYNFPFKNKPDKSLGSYDHYQFSGGIYTAAGIGFEGQIFKNRNIFFTIGHSFKKLKADMWYTPCAECDAPPTDKYRFSYGRLEFKTGIRF